MNLSRSTYSPWPSSRPVTTKDRAARVTPCRADGPQIRDPPAARALSSSRIEAELEQLEAEVLVVPEVVLEAPVEERYRNCRCRGDTEAPRERGIDGGVHGDGDEQQGGRHVHELRVLRPLHRQGGDGADHFLNWKARGIENRHGGAGGRERFPAWLAERAGPDGPLG